MNGARRSRGLCGALLLAALVEPAALRAQDVPDTAALYYHGYTYGSQALFSPVTVVLNKGFDIFQLSTSTRYPWSFPYGSGIVHVLGDAIRHPVAAI